MQIRAKAPRIDRRLVNHDEDERDRQRDQRVSTVREEARQVREMWESMMNSITTHLPELAAKAETSDSRK